MKRVIGLIGLICLVCNGVMGQTFIISSVSDKYSRYLSRSMPGINVEKFKRIDEDITTTMKSQLYKNGKIYALIKVSIYWDTIYDEKDYKLDFKLDASEKVITNKNDKGEIWLYVPSGTRQIHISQKKTGMQKKYSFPIYIEGAAVYEMGIVVQETCPSLVFFQLDSVSNADIYIDNKPIATYIYKERVEGYSEIRKGKHHYRVEAPGYISKTDTFTIYDDFNNMFSAEIQLEALSATPSIAPIAMIPPVVTIIPPAEYPNFSDTKLEIQYHIETAPNNPIKEVKVTVNGEIQPQARVVSKGRSVTVILPKHDSSISITACNQSGWSEPKFLNLKWDSSKEMIIRPNLYVLAIGINNYDNITPPLKFAVKDMTDFIHAVQTKKMSPYEEIFVTKLSDKQATRQKIEDELVRLSQKAEDTDFTFIYFSGHGLKYKEKSFYLAPVDANKELIPSTCIDADKFSKYLGEIHGKVVVFIDACYSGSLLKYQKAVSTIDMQEIVSDMCRAKPGRYIYASSQDDAVSNERPEWGNGAFTKALIEAFNGKARVDNKKILSTFDLMDYLRKRMKEILRNSDQQQKPGFSNLNEEFPLFTY